MTFKEFVRESNLSVYDLAHHFRVTPVTIYHWMNQSVTPTPKHRKAIIALSDSQVSDNELIINDLVSL